MYGHYPPTRLNVVMPMTASSSRTTVAEIDKQLDALRSSVHVAVARAGLETVTEGRELGELIRQERKARGLSLEEVAQRAGMSKGHVWDLEQGNARNPTVQACHGISQAIGVPFLVVCAAALLATKNDAVLVTETDEIVTP